MCGAWGQQAVVYIAAAAHGGVGIGCQAGRVRFRPPALHVRLRKRNGARRTTRPVARMLATTPIPGDDSTETTRSPVWSASRRGCVYYSERWRVPLTTAACVLYYCYLRTPLVKSRCLSQHGCVHRSSCVATPARTGATLLERLRRRGRRACSRASSRSVRHVLLLLLPSGHGFHTSDPPPWNGRLVMVSR